jgi:RNA polymerase-binding transcription factor DksA
LLNVSQTISRYSDAELEEFRQLILDRYQKNQEELDDLRAQIMDINENLADEFGQDYMDDSSTGADLEMLNNMYIRKRKYLQDLENALIRIKNKTYGVCSITGELIDKARLRAVPTTTKSLLGKNLEQAPPPPPPTRTDEVDEEDDEPKPKVKAPAEKKIITRIIRKSSSTPRPPLPDDDDDLDDDYPLDLDDIDDQDEDEGSDGISNDEPFDFDSLPASA